MIIDIIRHTKVYNPKNLCYGHFEIPLAETSQSDIHQASGQVADQYSAVFTSPSHRTSALAQGLQRGLVLPEPRLKEMNFGSWEGRPWDAISRDELDLWAKDIVNYIPPGGESFQQVADRAQSFLKSIQHIGYDSVLLVTHKGTIWSMLSYLKSKSLDEAMTIDVAYGQLFRFAIP